MLRLRDNRILQLRDPSPTPTPVIWSEQFIYYQPQRGARAPAAGPACTPRVAHAYSFFPAALRAGPAHTSRTLTPHPRLHGGAARSSQGSSRPTPDLGPRRQRSPRPPSPQLRRCRRRLGYRRSPRDSYAPPGTTTSTAHPGRARG